MRRQPALPPAPLVAHLGRAAREFGAALSVPRAYYRRSYFFGVFQCDVEVATVRKPISELTEFGAHL